MRLILEEVRESYQQEFVCEVPPNTMDGLKTNVQHVCAWCDRRVKANKVVACKKKSSTTYVFVVKVVL